MLGFFDVKTSLFGLAVELLRHVSGEYLLQLRRAEAWRLVIILVGKKVRFIKRIRSTLR